MFKKEIILFSILSCITVSVNGQIGIGTTSPKPSSILDVESTTKGFLPPRVDSDAMVTDPAEGLIIYDRSDNCLNVWNNSEWVNLCENTGGSGGGSNASMSDFDCSTAFNNLSSFGVFANASSYRGSSYYQYNFHLNEDGSKLFSNRGLYYNSTPDGVLYNNDNYGIANATIEVAAVTQKFPGKTWRTFYSVDQPYDHNPEYLYLLSKDGELHSMALHEKNYGTTVPYPGITTDHIDPSNDNLSKIDVIANNSTTDYRYIPHQHFANDDISSSIKFDRMYAGVRKTGSSGNEYTVLAYSETEKKFYSMGVKQANGGYNTKETAANLYRNEAPANLRESYTLKEATAINTALSIIGEEFTLGDEFNQSLIAGNYTAYADVWLITKTGDVIVIKGSDRIYRIKMPIGVKAKTMGGQGQYIIGDDGKLYNYPSTHNNSTYSPPPGYAASVNTIIGVKTFYYFESSADATPDPVPQLSGIDIKNYYNITGTFNYLLDNSGKMYQWNSVSTGTLTDLSTKGVPTNVEHIVASKGDIIAKTTDGTTFRVDYSGAGTQTRFPDEAAGAEFDLEGFPIPSSEYENKVARRLNNCYGDYSTGGGDSSGGSTDSTLSSISPGITGVGYSDTEVFKNIRVARRDINPYTDNHNLLDIHMSADGKRFFSSDGHLYDTSYASLTPYIYSSISESMMTTVPVNAVTQVFPGKIWKDFVYYSRAVGYGVEQLFLLDKDGVINSMSLFENSAANYQKRVIASEEIDPLDDNKMTLDASGASGDYRFTPYTHLVDGTDATIKFTSIFMNTTLTAPSDVLLFAYDSLNNKMYSMGARVNGTGVNTMLKTTNKMFRTTVPATLKESVTLKEAVLLNNLLAHWGTRIVQDDKTRCQAWVDENGNFRFFTTDGYINRIDGTTVLRNKLPTGVTPVEYSNRYSLVQYILGSDGNLYRSPHSATGSTWGTFNTVSTPILGTTYSIGTGTVPALLGNSSNPTINALNIKRVIGADNGLMCLTDEGKLYEISISPTVVNIDNDYFTDGLPLLDDLILASGVNFCVGRTLEGRTIVFNSTTDDQASSAGGGYLGIINRATGEARFNPDGKIGKSGESPKGRLFYQYQPIQLQE